MKIAVIIPSRLKSTRLPNKPLADILGKPMIQHVWERAIQANAGPVAVACCEDEVYNLIAQLGGQAIMTDPGLPSGSDRVYAALQSIKEDFDAVVCLQGDLPALDPEHIKRAVELLNNPEVSIGTLAALITDPEEINNPNVVKIALPLLEKQGTARAFYFSRAPLPAAGGRFYHHIGIYAYRREALARFIALPQGALEQAERLEQLRALENGMRIEVGVVDTIPLGVDTPADLEKVKEILKGLSQ